MGMRSRKVLLLASVLCLALLLSGCRVRTGGTGTVNAGTENHPIRDVSGSGYEPMDGAYSEDGADPAAAESGETDSRETDEMSIRTKENPDASRKEYDENAPAEIAAGTDHLLHGEGEGSGASLVNIDASETVNRLNDQAEKPASRTVPAQEAEQRGVSEDAEAADSAMTYFTVLLQDRLGSMYECQRISVYWETARDHVTIHKSSPEHALILNAGVYDVSARLLEKNLQVNDGWVERKNPGTIVKVVDKSVLGSGVHSTAGAEAVRQSLLSRPGWSGIDAVKNRQVLLLSEEMTEAPYLQTMAMLLIAKVSYPSLFADVDPEQALQMLAEEATGTLPAGILYDPGPENH